MLPLSGIATAARGLSGSQARTVLRLRDEGVIPADVKFKNGSMKHVLRRAMDDVVFLPFGQWDIPLAYRADRIAGIVPNTGLVVLWGITKK